MTTSNVSIPAGELDCTIVSFADVGFVFFMNTISRIPASEAKVDQPDFILFAFAEAKQQVGALYISMNILLVVDVF